MMTRKQLLIVLIVTAIATVACMLALMFVPHTIPYMKAIISIPGYNAPVIVRVTDLKKHQGMYQITGANGSVYTADPKNVLLVEEKEDE